MPRLVERADGGYFVRHFYHENSTWQIENDGVRFLAQYEITLGNLFRTDLFMMRRLEMTQLMWDFFERPVP